MIYRPPYSNSFFQDHLSAKNFPTLKVWDMVNHDMATHVFKNLERSNQNALRYLSYSASKFKYLEGQRRFPWRSQIRNLLYKEKRGSVSKSNDC